MGKEKRHTTAPVRERRIFDKRPAPSTEMVTWTLTLPRFAYHALLKGEAGYVCADRAAYTDEAKLKVIEYGEGRLMRDGAKGADTCAAQGIPVVSHVQEHAENRQAMLRGERPLVTREGRVAPIVDATRRVLLKVLTQQGVKLADVGKLGSTVEDAWAAAAKALPAIVKNREVLDAQAQSIAEALDLSGIKLDLSA